MAQQFDTITWSFSLDDWGTYGSESGYMGKLEQLKNGYNTAITAVNAQLQAGDDSSAIKAAIESIRDNEITPLKNEAKQYRDEAEQIALADISNTNVVFNSVTIQGTNILNAINNINTLLLSDENTLDTLQEIVNFIQLNKSTLDTLGISNIAGLQAALDSHTAQINQNTVFALAGMVM